MPAPSFDVIVHGSLHLDILVRAPSLPRLDETAVGQTWGRSCGGKGGHCSACNDTGLAKYQTIW